MTCTFAIGYCHWRSTIGGEPKVADTPCSASDVDSDSNLVKNCLYYLHSLLTLGITAMQNKLFFFLTGDFSEGQTHKKQPEKKMENDTSVMFKQNILANNGQNYFKRLAVRKHKGYGALYLKAISGWFCMIAHS